MSPGNPGSRGRPGVRLQRGEGLAKNPPANAGDMGSILGLVGPYMLQSN